MAMSAGRRSGGGAARSTAGRGIVLIVFGVILGVVLLRNGFSNGSSSAAGTNSTRGETTTLPPTTAPVITSPPSSRAPSQVTVIVANGSGKQGAARNLANQLVARGFVANGVNTSNNTLVATTSVYFAGDYQNEAKAIAALIHAPAAAVLQMPAQPPVDPKNLTGAGVLIVLGPDLAL